MTIDVRMWRSVGALWLLAMMIATARAAESSEPTSPPHVWPQRPTAPEGAPNVLIWMIDDAGFAQVGAFGGLIDTPTIDSLARQGLRYTSFHSTALCSASRAALLTGRNAHAVSVGSHAGIAAPYPGYLSRVPKSAATIARVLQMNGYATFALGKWDHLPSEDVTPSGPFTYWPSGQGFERFYGFLAADTDNFRPVMWLDHEPVDPGRGREDYHVSTDMADRAIEWIAELQQTNPQKPFLMYWASGAVHTPHHAPRANIDAYQGRFAMGWDKAREQILARQKEMGIVPASVQLPARPDFIPAWDSESTDGKRLYATMMEVFAAQLTHADHEFGRIVETLRRSGELDNTIVIVTSDNGASAEGSPTGSWSEFRFNNGVADSLESNLRFEKQWGGPSVYAHYAVGWTMAGNTPFKYWKQTNHEGGVREPFVVSWPKRIRDRGGIRPQFHHLNDIAPTLLEAIGINAPAEVDGVAQQPIDGISMLYSFADAAAPSRKQQQYFEMMGNRAIWSDGWKAVVLQNPYAWKSSLASPPMALKMDGWELYNLNEDFNELSDLAQREPAKLEQMKALFDAEARRNNVYPMRPSPMELIDKYNADRLRLNGGRFVYTREGGQRIGERAAPPVINRAHAIIADIGIPAAGAHGVIVAQGGRMGGYALHISGGRAVYSYNSYGEAMFTIAAREPLRPGKHRLRFEFTPAAGLRAQGVLQVDGKEAARGTIENVEPVMFSHYETMDVGTDHATAVVAEYADRPEFTGTIEQVVFEVPVTP
jgi:arylsulfatase A-like enzyme